MTNLNNVPRFDTHSHSEYSNIRLIDSINRIPDMLRTAAKLGMKGLALTDHECLCGHLKWLEAEKELKEKEIIPKDFKAALGNEIYLVEDRNNIERYWHYILIAKNDLGHRALRELSSKAWYHSYSSNGMTRVPTEMNELEKIVNKYPNSLITTSACFREGTKVVTQNGEKNIEDITKNDYILNRYGQWEKVNFPTKRKYKGNGIEILFCENPTSTICTENHKFLVTTANKISHYKSYGKNPLEWVEAKKLNTSAGSFKHICLKPIQEIKYTNDNIIHKKEWKNCLKLNSPSLKTSLKEEILITPEVMRLFGLWLGDGSISINKEKRCYAINFTFSYEEFKYYWDSFVKIASENIGITWSINYRPESNRVDIASHSIELVELFYFLFGCSHAKDKYIPKRLLHITEELDFNLFIGYALADGYFRTRKKGGYLSGEFCSTSISKQLTYDFQKLLTSLHLRSSITISKEKVDKNGVHHYPAYYLSSSNKAWALINKKRIISNGDVIKYKNIAQDYDKKKFIKIDDILYKKVYIKKYKEIELDETVYCLNVNSHSFVCNGVIVHNCLGNYMDDRTLKLITAENNNDINKINELKKEIDEYLKWNIKLFGDDFYIEIAAGSSPQQRAFNQRIKNIAKHYNRKLVIGSDAHYLTAEYRNIHKAYLNSKEGEREVDAFYWDAHMMDNNEAYENLKDIFTEEEFIEICNNTMEIYDKIEEYHLTRNPIIPEIQVKNYPKIVGHSKYNTLNYLLNSDEIQERYWVNQCLRALQNKKIYEDKYLQRLEVEADIIKTVGDKLGNCLFKYFNTFQHFIDLFWSCGSIVGPGRGSSVCFLSNYLLGITQLNPVDWNLREWRFLNKERLELPKLYWAV